jgi:predicted RNase H-like HicB family nuclease
MKTFIAIVERCPKTGLYVGSLPGLSDEAIQAETLDELYGDLQEIFEMFLEDEIPVPINDLIGIQTVTVA